jgi:hypothetical protein
MRIAHQDEKRRGSRHPARRTRSPTTSTGGSEPEEAKGEVHTGCVLGILVLEGNMSVCVWRWGGVGWRCNRVAMPTRFRAKVIVFVWGLFGGVDIV